MLGVDAGEAFSHVDERGARLAGVLLDTEDPGDEVLRVWEVRHRSDGLPAPGLVLEDRRECEPQRGEREGRRRDAARAVRDARHKPSARDGLALERAGHVSFGCVLGLGLASVCHVPLYLIAGPSLNDRGSLQSTTRRPSRTPHKLGGREQRRGCPGVAASSHPLGLGVLVAGSLTCCVLWYGC